jgi:hypothetical protein
MTDLDPTASRRRFGSRKIILVVLAGLAIFGVALFFILKSALGPVIDAGDAFMAALRDRNDTQAYAAAAPDLQQRLGSVGGLTVTVDNYRPSQWSWSTRSVRNGTGDLSGNVTYQGGNRGTAELRLSKIDGGWRVTAFRFN